MAGTSIREELPVAVIGGGPIGLAAAAHLAERGAPWVVFEAGPAVGTSVLEWGHVRLFSPWSANIDPAARRLLDEHGWEAPDLASHPTGHELVTRYLEPLAKVPPLTGGVQLDSWVRSVSRGADKAAGALRDGQPFVLTVRQGGVERRVQAGAVIDASGTWSSPHPLGAGGNPALGEADAAHAIAYRIPDVLGQERERYAGSTVVVVGSGHSAQNVVRDLTLLAEQERGTRVIWAIRRDGADLLSPGQDHELPARARLQAEAQELVASGVVELVTAFRTDRVSRQRRRVVLHDGGRRLGPADEVIASTGFRPDLVLLRELRLDLDPVLESPRPLAPIIDPALHSCAMVPAHGASELRHPEPGAYVVGVKSYGRAPTFLASTGYAQVRSVVADIVGDPLPLAVAAGGCCGGGC